MSQQARIAAWEPHLAASPGEINGRPGAEQVPIRSTIDAFIGEHTGPTGSTEKEA